MRLVLVNPVHIKRIKKIQDNSPNKTDKKDPRVIADLIELGCVLSVIFPEFHQIFKSMKSKTVCYLLMNYPVPEDVSATDINELASQLRSISRGRMKCSQVEEFQILAQVLKKGEMRLSKDSFDQMDR